MPCATLQVQHPEACQVTCICIDLTTQNKVTKTVYTQERISHPNPVEQCRARKLQIFLVVSNC